LNDYADEKPASHVAVDLSESRLDGLWRGVSAGLDPTRPRQTVRPTLQRRWLVAGSTLFAAGAAALAIAVGAGQLGGSGQVESSAWEGASLETGVDGRSVRLVDGSELKLDPASRLEVDDRTPSAVKLVLKRGRLDCDVPHRPGRSFVVMADGVEVRVVGTRFSVATEHDGSSARVQVRVERGVVEVRSAGAEVVRVQAGRSWSQVISTQPPGDTPAETAAAAPPATIPAPDPAPRTRATSSSARSVPPAAASHGAQVRGPRQLFGQARDQWRRGRVQDAADTYQTLLTEFPGDGRAGLAAFELGRLRMDRLGDLPGAARALERAVALAPGSEFREDAMARLVAAHAGAHNLTACIRARDQYLVEFPRGVHRRIVAAGCR
jgi:transmembrane sensor